MTPDRSLDFGDIDRAPPNWNPQRPLRIALLGDFGGNALAGRLDIGVALARRKPRKVEFDTLDRTMARMCPALRIPIGTEGATVSISLTGLEAFEPDTLVRELDVFKTLSALRRRLGNRISFAQAAEEVADWGLAERPTVACRPDRSPARGSRLKREFTLDDFARLGAHPPPAARPVTPESLLRQLVGPFIQGVDPQDQDALVAALDQTLAHTLSDMLHQPDLQHAEALWRGVDFLLHRLDPHKNIELHLFDISAEEFAADLATQSDLAQSGLYKLLVDDPVEESDGGYSYVAACYRFEATPPQIELLGRAARICAFAGAPLVTAMEPETLIEPGQDAPHPLVRAAFGALRALPEAGFLSLLAPRFLLRLPYGRASEPISSFRYEEFTAASGLRGMLWGHPALLALCLVAGPADALTLGQMPFHHYTDADGDRLALPCTERLLGIEAAARLRAFGINAVLSRKGEPQVRFAGLETVDGGLLRMDGSAARPVPARTPLPAPSAPLASPAPPASTAPPPPADLSAPPSGQRAELAQWLAATPAGREASDADDALEMDPDLKALLASLD